MGSLAFDFKARWARAASLMEAEGVDALVLMKPANLAYFTGVGIEHEEAPMPGGHAVIHGEEKIEQVEAGMALAIGNCGIYRDEFGVRVEDTVWVSADGPVPLTRHDKAPAA